MKASDLVVGKEYILKEDFGSLQCGTVLELVRFDSDGDPHFLEKATGRREWSSVSTSCRILEPATSEYDSQWIVFNAFGSVLADSEEDAKRRAEEMLSEDFDDPIYIAKACNKVTRTSFVWAG